MSPKPSFPERLEAVLRADVRAQKAYPVADATGLLKLDLMENPFGLPEALKDELGRLLAALALNRYPEPRPAALLSALRAELGVPDEAGLMLGNGSDELISLIAVAVARPGAKILAPVPTFVMYEASARQAQIGFVPVPLLADFTLDLEAMLAAIDREKPAVVYLSYPNNPTGTLYPRAAVAAILAAAPGLVVVDEAYQPFAGETWMPETARSDNLLVMRTLSKSGLAGVRLGYLAGRREWIDEFDKVRPPFNVNVLTQCCVEFVLRHKDVLDAQAEVLRRERGALARALAALPGVSVFPSAANFLLFRIEAADPGAATRVFAGLKAHGVLIKNLSAAHPLLANALRVTVSSADENALFLKALSASLPLADAA